MYIGQSWGTTSREPTCGGCKIKQHCADGDDSRRRSCRIKKGSCGKLPKLGRCYYQTSRTTNRGGWSARTWFPHMPRSTHRGQEVTSRKSISEGWRWGLYHSAIWIIGHPGSDKRNNHAYSKKRLKVTKKIKSSEIEMTSHWQWLGSTGTAAKTWSSAIYEIAANGSRLCQAEVHRCKTQQKSR